MARLPQPGSDSGTWGDILNDYLSQTHNPDGTLRSDVVSSSNISDGSIDAAKLAESYVQSSEKGSPNGVATLDGSGKVPTSQLPPGTDPVMGGEDFGRFSLDGRQVPVTIFWLGAVDPAKVVDSRNTGTPLPSPSRVTRCRSRTGGAASPPRPLLPSSRGGSRPSPDRGRASPSA